MSDAGIHYFAVEWPSDSDLHFAQFLEEVRGHANPALANERSIRGLLYRQWESIGLQSRPSIADNGLHASASPFEAMMERHVWLDTRLEDDHFMRALTASVGIPPAVVRVWMTDPVVTYDWSRCHLFDLLKGLNTADCLQKATFIHAENDGTLETFSSTQSEPGQSSP